MLWSREGGLTVFADKKRRNDRPYVVGQWCNQTFGAWSIADRGRRLTCWASTRPGSRTGMRWSAGASSCTRSTGARDRRALVGGEDIFQFPEVINGSPHVYALFPHAASLFYRGVPARAAAGRHQAARPACGAARAGTRPTGGW